MAVSRDIEWVPSRRHVLVFEAKAWALRLQRMAHDRINGSPARHRAAERLRDAPIIAEYSGRLWPREEADPNLVVGKLQNLRQAARRLHGIEPDAGQELSFWKQVGRASARKGYAIGRELREGCLIPALGGGLCQLSNAIHDCAVRAGMTIVERHRHSRVLPGSLAEQDRDATVFWNYLDLRIVAPFAWRLEIELDEDELHVRIRGRAVAKPQSLPLVVQARDTEATSDCTNCGEVDCHRHVGERGFVRHRAWLLDEDWPEFRAYRRESAGAGDRVIECRVDSGIGRIVSLHARCVRRWLLWRGRPIPQARQRGLELLAQDIERRLRPDDVDLVVSQGLLPYLWRNGVLGGRRFDVLMTALPMTWIQQRLDAAHLRHPQSRTLADFRASADLIEAEREALARANRWITPHAQIARLAKERALLLDWQQPAASPSSPIPTGKHSPSVLLPASSLARKGVYELREALRGLRVRLLLPPGGWETPDFWDGFDVQGVASIADGVARCDVAVLPAWIEHQPRGLLLAMAAGKPVIATAACGLPGTLRWRCIDEGDVVQLREALQDAPWGECRPRSIQSL